MRLCKECGGEIPPTLRRGTKYCCSKCRLNAWRHRYPEKYRQTAARRLRERKLRNPALAVRQLASTRRWGRIQTYGYDIGDDPLAHTKDRFRRARALGYRSGFEVAITNQLTEAQVPFKYEPVSLPFIPRKTRTYKPDILLENGILIEVKGRFESADRAKHIEVKAAHPLIDVRFIFSNSRQKIAKKSQTTYAAWCLSKGYKFADKLIPAEWIAEPVNRASLDAINALIKEQTK